MDEALAGVLACERRIVNAWPAAETLLVDGFVLRFAQGYSGRANSLSATEPGATLSADRLAWAEALFRARGLTPCVRVTPLADPAFEARLLARGYRVKDRSVGMTGTLAAWARPDEGVRIASRPDDAWVRGVSARQTGDKKDADDRLAAIVGRIPVPAAFATFLHGGAAIGFGMSAAEPPLAEFASIMVDEEARGRGVGRTLMGALAQWARERGAERGFLQVEAGNAPALALYRRLGFQPLYDYTTLVLPD